MKSSINIKKFSFVLIFLVVTMALSGCGEFGPKSRKPAGDFSRGLPLSTEAIAPPAMSVGMDTGIVQVVIPSPDEEDLTTFRYILINQDGQIAIQKDLDLGLPPYVRSPKLIENNKSQHLVWAARDSTTEGWKLFHAIFDIDGEVISPPKLISKGTERVSQYELTGDSLGNLSIAWEDRGTGSIWIARISGEGSILTSPQVAVLEGEYPALIANMGTIHMSWMEGERLQYAQVNENSSYPLMSEQLDIIQVARGNSMDGPVIGYSDGEVYLFWSVLRQVGLEAGTAITEFLVFPEDDPAQISRGVIPILPVLEELMAPYQGPLALTLFVPAPPEEYMTTDYVLGPQTLPKPTSEVQVVAVSANQAIRLDAITQIVLCLFEDGVYQGCTIGSRTTEISQNPLIAVDDSGNIHLMWQEGHVGKKIYYATTSPEAKSRLDRISLDDLPSLFLAGGMEAITGILLFPFAFPWMAIGFVIMIGLRIARNDEDVTQRLSQILLGVALLTYQISKLMLLPDILIYVPFSAWVDIPEGVGKVLRILVPIIIIGLGIIVAELRRRRRPEDSPVSSLGYYMTAVIVDTVITLSIYGVIFMGEY
jgi:hypothetical protein